MPYIYKYPRFQVTVDCLLVCIPKKSVLLIRRENEPFKNLWAIPGGFVDPTEGLESAAIRELAEETSVRIDYAQQFKTYGNPGRDPRGRNISIVFTQTVEYEIEAVGADDASEAKWFPVNKLPSLAFDHKVILNDVFQYYALESSS